MITNINLPDVFLIIGPILDEDIRFYYRSSTVQQYIIHGAQCFILFTCQITIFLWI